MDRFWLIVLVLACGSVLYSLHRWLEQSEKLLDARWRRKGILIDPEAVWRMMQEAASLHASPTIDADGCISWRWRSEDGSEMAIYMSNEALWAERKLARER